MNVRVWHVVGQRLQLHLLDLARTANQRCEEASVANLPQLERFVIGRVRSQVVAVAVECKTSHV